MDYQIGEDIKEKLIPRAIDWYTGKALKYEEIEDDHFFVGDEEDDEDDDDRDDEDDEDDDDDEVSNKIQFTFAFTSNSLIFFFFFFFLTLTCLERTSFFI